MKLAKFAKLYRYNILQSQTIFICSYKYNHKEYELMKYVRIMKIPVIHENVNEPTIKA